MNYEIKNGNCVDIMRAMPDNSVDSIVTDPPYELGFMGKTWDASGIAYSIEMWSEALRVLKPGGHLLAFSGSRTYHRMACAIEDAGFDIRDQIMWVYGSGFPKSLDVSKAIDKAAGAVREMVPRTRTDGKATGREASGFMDGASSVAMTTSTEGITDAARQWEGWGTALKPAHEPICVARKPLAKGLTVATNVLAHGTGAINIDACRVNPGEAVPGGGGLKGGATSRHEGWQRPAHLTNVATAAHNLGRWPANLIHDGSDEVLAGLPEQSSGSRAAGVRTGMGFHGADGDGGPAIAGSSGSAARFFYCAKASKADRGGENSHPTVKPTALMAYLVRLVTPPGGLVLDPFTGSGSTGKAAVREGFRFVGCELSPEYAAIAEARIADELCGGLL